MNGPRWLSEWMALGFPWRVIAACVLLLTGLASGVSRQRRRRVRSSMSCLSRASLILASLRF
jgi:hypothetical protein